MYWMQKEQTGVFGDSWERPMYSNGLQLVDGGGDSSDKYRNFPFLSRELFPFRFV